MLKSLRHRLSHAGNFRIYAAQSTVYVEPLDDAADISAAYDVVRKLFGLMACAGRIRAKRTSTTSSEGPCLSYPRTHESPHLQGRKPQGGQSGSAEIPEISNIVGGEISRAFRT